jgi:tRNA threonylcarbamoyladenosine modification (KEOPS) complex Cgi121 subunit
MHKSNFIIKEATPKTSLNGIIERLSMLNGLKNVIQVFDADYIINRSHLAGAYIDAELAFKSGSNISKSIATEMLLFAAMTKQISVAIKKAGAKPGKNLVVFANSPAAYNKIKPLLVNAKDFKRGKSEILSKARGLGIKEKGDLDIRIFREMAASRLE